MVNDRWRVMFSEASIVCLPCFKYDHSPLWLRINPGSVTNDRRHRPFCFLAAWVTMMIFRML